MNRIPITRPSITEAEISNVTDAIRYGWGPKCYEYIDEFERRFAEYLGVKHGLATSCCTGAIHLALMALGVEPGDEVILPELTWIASVEPVMYIGAKPVFVDVKKDTWCIDPAQVEQAITPKTKAIIVVHLYGNVVEMDEIMEIAQKHGIKVLEDAAEGLGSEYRGKKVGSLAHAAVFSFHGTKTISTGEGGMLLTDDPRVMERAVILNNHGQDPNDGKTFWMAEYGYKYKMSNLQAAMGCAQIERADELIAQKVKIFNWYKQGFSDVIDVTMNYEQEYVKNSYWMPTVIFGESLGVNRDELISFLKENNIDSRPFFYPLSSLPMFNQKIGNRVSYELYLRGVNLPSYYVISEEQVRIVCEFVCKFISNNCL